MAGSGSSLIKTIIILVISAIIFGSLIDYAAYYTSATKTPNVTGFGAVIVQSLFIGVLALVVLMMYLGKI